MNRDRLRAAIVRTYRRMGVRHHWLRLPEAANDAGQPDEVWL